MKIPFTASKEQTELANAIIYLLECDPHGWSFTPYEALYNDIVIWIENAKYADLRIKSVGNERIAGGANRQRVRDAMTWAKAQQARASLYKKK